VFDESGKSRRVEDKEIISDAADVPNMAEAGETAEPETSWVENPKVRKILQRHLDETDYRIYKELNADGRLSDTELGSRVGLSRTAARRRRKKMQEEGLLDVLGVLVLQEAELAYADVRVRFASDADDSDLEEFVDELIEDELVYEIDEYMGEYDLLVRIWHASLSDIKSYLRERLQRSSSVETYEATPVTRTIKAWHKTLNGFGDDRTDA
jgi:DNA-binding Lrp family transcriptional regulator